MLFRILTISEHGVQMNLNYLNNQITLIIHLYFISIILDFPVLNE